MNTRNPFFLLAVVVSLFMVSCSKSSEDNVAPGGSGGPGSCDTVNMKYTANIVPILKTNCYSCHGGDNPPSGIKLDVYDNIKLKADNGQLIGVITHANGFPAMPKGLPMLSSCDINKIRAWVNRGAANN